MRENDSKNKMKKIFSEDLEGYKKIADAFFRKISLQVEFILKTVKSTKKDAGDIRRFIKTYK